jgi:nucleoside-diphosphate-sugar epimerase
MHLVLGGTGGVGQAVIKDLITRGLPVKAVERSKDVKGVETIKADLLDAGQTKQAIAGAEYVYLCIGLPYFGKVWTENWPKIMNNVIEACVDTNAKLIFLDNIYMYGPAPLPVPFDENTSKQPTSVKGQARKVTEQILLDAMAAGKVKAVIGRSADFYGPGAVNTLFYSTFLTRMATGKAPQWLGSVTAKHTYSYSLDNGRALVELALDDSCYGQTWHLPVGQPIDVAKVLEMFNKEFNAQYKLAVIPRFMNIILSAFIGQLRELKEMAYQFDDEYVMSDAKFRQHFPAFQTTSYEQGIKEMVAAYKESATK